MKITLKDTKPYPVWLLPKHTDPGILNSLLGPPSYYRLQQPAKLCGGRIIRSIQVIDGSFNLTPLGLARQTKQYDLCDPKQRLEFLTLPQPITVVGMGTPTVISAGMLYHSAREWTLIVSSLRDAGATIVLEADDDVFTAVGPAGNRPDLHQWALKSATEAVEKERDAITKLMLENRVYATKAEVDIWWASFLPGYIRKKIEGFDLAPLTELVGAFSSIVCSTEVLRTSFERQCGRSLKCTVAPNVIDPADFKPVSREGEIVRIGYCGTRQHDSDMHLVAPAFAECAKLPGVEFTFFGWHPRWQESVDPGPYEWPDLSGARPYVYGGQFNDFHEFIQRIGVLDVAVAPLEANEFNNAKSPQKWFEHAMHRTAMVLSEGPVYACATHIVDCFKANNAAEFTHYLLKLATDAELRKRIGEAARAQVLSHHTINQWSEVWRQAVGVKELAAA